MLHIQLRQFPNATSAFNLSEELVRTRILEPWVTGRAVEWDERSWDPAKARLTIYEGPELRPEQMGLGRGWANVTKQGREVTSELLTRLKAPAEPGDLKRAILERCPAPLTRMVELARTDELGIRPSERLALVEQAVWEMLHGGLVVLRTGDRTLGRQEWQAVLLDWNTWADPQVELERAVSGEQPTGPA